MLARTEATTRQRMENAQVTLRVARWVAGGSTRQDRERRADVALYARKRLGCEGWPEHWILGAFAAHDTGVNQRRRDRGLYRLPIEETCAEFALPTAPPLPKRDTLGETSGIARAATRVGDVEAPACKRVTKKKQREAAEALELAALLERVAAHLRDQAAAAVGGGR